MTDAASDSSHWHELGASEALDRLEATPAGLSSAEAGARLSVHGRNAMPHKPPPGWWQIGLRQFKSPIIYILAIAAAMSLAIGHATDAAFIAAVLAVNALIGGAQEWQAERSAQALQKLLRMRAFVQRDGETTEIDAEEVAPGDIVWLEPGYRAPADARLLSAHGLEVDESLLTGESVSVSKDADWTGARATPLADRRNMVFAGSIVSRGRGRAVVVATGERTELGRVAEEMQTTEHGKPPLLERMARFSRVVAVAVLLAALLIGVIGVVGGRYSVTEMFFFGIALAVSAIPEGLPVSITVALAVASIRMARRKVVVRRLHAVEGLGSCTLVASDKTGTLTCNELTVREIALADGEGIEVTGEGFEPSGALMREGRGLHRGDSAALDGLLTAAVLCNEGDLHHRDGAWIWRGDPTDVALLTMARKAGVARAEAVQAARQINEIPFEPEHRFAATFHEEAGEIRAYVKGAPERVLRMCRFASDDDAAAWMDAAQQMAERGLRVLAFAAGPAGDAARAEEAPPTPDGLTFLGFVGMIDPLRPGVREAVRATQRAGVRVCMVTGDHPVTALAISRALGFAETLDDVVTGAELAELDEDARAERIARGAVFARVAPDQKLDIVQAAQRAGDFVAVTGDGVNDAPALRAANIGVAMGRAGTDVAREAADLVISDDNFATIVGGVEEGRIAYDNIRKVVFLLVATGAAEVVLVTLSFVTGSPLPLLPAQILWLNLVTNGIQDKALAFEPGEGDVMERRPRSPRERIFNRVMIRNCLWSALLMGGMGFAAFRWMLENGWSEQQARNGLLLLMVLFENVLIGSCRSETKPALSLSPLRSPLLLVGALTAFGVHVLAMHTTFGARVLDAAPVSLDTWTAFAGIAILLFVLVELQKWVSARLFGRRRRG